MNRAIEIHDSELESVIGNSDDVVLRFSKVYIHSSEGLPRADPGSGWLQPAVLRIRNGVVHGSISGLPCWLADGSVTLDCAISHNLIPIPLNYDGRVEVSLTSSLGESMVVQGDQVALELIGEAQYLEQFPGEDSA